MIESDRWGTWEVTEGPGYRIRTLISASQEYHDSQDALRAEKALADREVRAEVAVERLNRERATVEAEGSILLNEANEEDAELFAALLKPYDLNGRAYAVSDLFEWEGWPYIVQQAHTSQPQFTPDLIPALVVRYRPPGSVEPWAQPQSNNPYRLGDRVTHLGGLWESNHDANVWEPGVSQWTRIGDAP